MKHARFRSARPLLVTALLVLLAVGLVLVGCAEHSAETEDVAPHPLVGRWESGSSEPTFSVTSGAWTQGSKSTLSIERDGFGTLNNQYLIWRRDGDELLLWRFDERYPDAITTNPFAVVTARSEGVVTVSERPAPGVDWERQFARTPDENVYTGGQLVGRGEAQGYEVEFTEDGKLYEWGKHKGRFSVTELGCILVRYPQRKTPVNPREDHEAWRAARSPSPYGYVEVVDGEVRVHLYRGYHIADARFNVNYVVIE